MNANVKSSLILDSSMGVLRGNYDTLKPVLGLQICWATHPMQKNMSGNARGRCLHYRVSGQKLTLCNMRFTEAATKMTKEYGACSGKVCKTCVPKAEQFLLKFKSMGESHEPDCISHVATLNRFKCNCKKPPSHP